MPAPDADLWPLALLVDAVQRQAPGGVEALGVQWQRELDKLARRWRPEVSAKQQLIAEDMIKAAVDADNLDSLASLTVPAYGQTLLLDAMKAMAGAGAASVVAEAEAQGVPLELPAVASATLADWARITTERLAGSFAAGVRRVALQFFRPGVKASVVVAAVRDDQAQQGDHALRAVLGGALTRAQNEGRLDAYAATPAGWTLRQYADETLDINTCGPCRKINGTELPTPEAAALAYGGAGYIHCEGGERCRGTMIGVWTESGRGRRTADLWPLGDVLARTYKRDRRGRFGSGGGEGVGVPHVGGMKSDDAIHASFEYHDHATGMSVSVPTIREGAGGQRYVDIEIRNAGGDLVGSGTRTISADGLSVNHSSLGLSKTVQGQGLATRFNAHAETTYRANGVQKITLSAAHVGRYAWARAGYDFQRPTERTEVGWKVNVIAKNYDHATQAKIKALTSDPHWTPLELSAVGWTKGAKTWPGKEIMQHEDFPIWDGVKTL